MMISLLLGLVGALAPAHAHQNLSHEEFFAHAKPLILEFVGRKSREFGIDLGIDEGSWNVRHSTLIRHPMGFDLFWGGRYDYECRIVSGTIKGSNGRRAHFSVRVSYPENGVVADGENAHYELVPTCNRLDLTKKTVELRIDGVPKDRDFADDEVAAVALPMVQTLLVEQGRKGAVDPSTVSIRRRRFDDTDSFVGSWYRRVFARNLACRRLRVAIPSERTSVTTYVGIFYDADAPVPYLPAPTQTILKDKISLRSFRFALVGGCDNLGMFEKPRLTSKPYPVAAPMARKADSMNSREVGSTPASASK